MQFGLAAKWEAPMLEVKVVASVTSTQLVAIICYGLNIPTCLSPQSAEGALKFGTPHSPGLETRQFDSFSCGQVAEFDAVARKIVLHHARNETALENVPQIADPGEVR